MENVFTTKHLICFIYSLIFIFLLFYLSKKLKKKIEIKTLLKIGSLFLIMLEIIKIIYLLCLDQFTLNDLPFQFCSLMLYIYPLIAFSKNPKTINFFLPFAFACGFLPGLIAIVLPTNIMGNQNTSLFAITKDALPFISFTYHSFMIFYSLHLVTSNTYIPKYKDFFKTLIPLLSFALIAIILNIVLDQDYMLLNYGNGNPLKFILEKNYILYYLTHIIIYFFLYILLIFLTKTFHKNTNKTLTLNIK